MAKILGIKLKTINNNNNNNSCTKQRHKDQ